MASSGNGFSQRQRRQYKNSVIVKKANRNRNLVGCEAKQERAKNVR